MRPTLPTRNSLPRIKPSYTGPPDRRASRRFKSLESLEPRIVLDARLLISEIVADNETGLVDSEGDRTDWIEIYNAGDESENLQGWYLTDDADSKTKWSFPATVINPREHLIVHASGKNRVDATGELHTNFQLRSSGEFLALVHPDGRTIVDQFAPEFPPQQANIAFGLSQAILDNALVEAGDPAQWLVPDVDNGGDQLGKTWTETDFDDSDWSLGTNNIGFEKATGYEPLIGTDLLDSMTNSGTAYVRSPFQLDSSDAVYSLTLSMKYDDGYVAYLNGVEVGARTPPTIWIGKPMPMARGRTHWRLCSKMSI